MDKDVNNLDTLSVPPLRSATMVYAVNVRRGEIVRGTYAMSIDENKP